jgi:NADPH:quinone reductase-like Zn-dependent oxidoreductase
MSRFMSVKFPAVLGADFSGAILEVGPKVSGFAKGDEVFGTLDVSEIFRPGNGGSYAEYVIAFAKIDFQFNLKSS